MAGNVVKFEGFEILIRRILGMRRFKCLSLALLGLVAVAVPSYGAEHCQTWPLREVRGAVAYDGDTFYIELPCLGERLRHASVRIAGIDAPEIGWRAKCADERALAAEARARLIELLTGARSLRFCAARWDKYGGRVLASVRADGRDIGSVLVEEGLARPYDGGARAPWCE